MLFSNLQKLDKAFIRTSDLTTSFGWHSEQVEQQHDVHELNRVLFDVLANSLKHTSQKELVKNLYQGQFVSKVIGKCNCVSERQEDFLDIPLVVSGFTSIQESLSSYCKADKLDGDNQYVAFNLQEPEFICYPL